MKTTVELIDIAEVRSGFNARRRVEEAPYGAVQLLQMKDLNDAEMSTFEELMRIDTAEAPAERSLVHAGDIIIRTRGGSNAATYIAAEPTLPTLPASPLLLIRVAEGGRVLPAYLAWLLNQADVQEQITYMACRGTAVPLISKKMLEKITLSIHPMEQQEQIVQIAALSREVQQLTHELADTRARYVNALIR